MGKHQHLREQVAREYGIVLYRRYREKEAAPIVGYEAAWWKRHRKAGNIPYVRDPGGNISYFGYMLCDILILGKNAVRRGADGDEPSPSGPEESGSSGSGGTAIALALIKDR